MSTLSVRLPKSIHEQLKELAAEEGVSMNQFISIALAEKIASLKTVKYLEERAKRRTTRFSERIRTKCNRR